MHPKTLCLTVPVTLKTSVATICENKEKVGIFNGVKRLITIIIIIIVY
jgi:hypothetical protein